MSRAPRGKVFSPDRDPTDMLTFPWAPQIVVGEKKKAVGPYKVVHMRGALAVMRGAEILAAGRWDGRTCVFAHAPNVLMPCASALGARTAKACKEAWERELNGPDGVQTYLGGEEEDPR